MPRILIVEDEQLVREFVEFLLQQEGVDVICAADGDVAISLARQEMPDLMLLDVMLPSLDGFEVLRQMKSHDELKHIPVIVFTARNRDADITLAFEMGASDYICKPFSPNELVARIQRSLRESASRRPAV